jgi:V8-like Glu-specific endopeptidase
MRLFALCHVTGDKPEDSMWVGSSPTTTSVTNNSQYFLHSCPEQDGNSGSPIYVYYKTAVPATASSLAIPAGGASQET